MSTLYNAFYRLYRGRKVFFGSGISCPYLFFILFSCFLPLSFFFFSVDLSIFIYSSLFICFWFDLSPTSLTKYRSIKCFLSLSLSYFFLFLSLFQLESDLSNYFIPMSFPHNSIFSTVLSYEHYIFIATHHIQCSYGLKYITFIVVVVVAVFVFVLVEPIRSRSCVEQHLLWNVYTSNEKCIHDSC